MTRQKSCLLGEDVFTIPEFLTADECQELIQFSEAQGYEFATVGNESVPTLRNNARVTVDDLDRASWLWDRAKSFFPQYGDERQPIGLNQRLRFYRYDKQQHFDWHSDGIVSGDDGSSSIYTFMIYLNGGFQGGETAFHENRSNSTANRFQVTPTTGLALCFLHEIFHRSEAMISGRKYVLRTDVMYSSVTF